jgi:hypothetical protein
MFPFSGAWDDALERFITSGAKTESSVCQSLN